MNTDTNEGNGEVKQELPTQSKYYVMNSVGEEGWEQLSIGFDFLNDAVKFKENWGREVDKPTMRIFQMYT